MRTAVAIVMALMLSGCANMTHEQKRNTWIVVGAVVVTGAIIASKDGSKPPEECFAIGPAGSIEQRLC